MMRVFAAFLIVAGCVPAAPLFDAVERVLLQRCAKCHGAGAAQSDFVISTRAALLKGGKHGAAVVPGDAAGSRLYQWVSEGKMPPGQKLDAVSVASIKQWINGGAVWGPRESILQSGKRKYWAFEQPVKPSGASIDGLLLAKLHERGLDFSSRADHRTLIRRLYFDLTGLPPKPEDYKQTYVEAVERLLASPHYGERWGRHWLDVVRFGETDGGEHNYERFNAWPYRDWVIESLNQDKPYDRFIREQIAGDVLAPGDPKMVAATGFLVAGPWDQVSAVLNKDETLRQQARMDELDDMVTTTAHSFLALTVNCARCHDHKFDPIPARDYYRMTAFFSAVGFGEREVATAEQRALRDQFIEPLRKEALALRGKLGDIEDPVRTRLLLERYQEFDKQRAAEPRRITLNPVWNRNRFPEVKAEKFRFIIGKQTGSKARLAYLELLPAGPRSTDWKAEAAASADQPQVVRIDLPEPRSVSEIRWASDPVRGVKDGNMTVYRLEALVGNEWKVLCSSLDHVGANELEMPSIGEAELVAALPAEDRPKRKALLDELSALQRRMDMGPAVTKLYAAKPQTLEKAYLLERGNVKRQVEEVTPGTLSAVGGEIPALATDDPGARRVALANWIANPRNPLTARVIVNRVWYHHFGNGIVNTPSDFGINGDRPSHPELLDWLAVSFMENGWSLKWLHRQIVMTRAYQQSTAWNEKAYAVDAGNRLLWRMPMKRMDAETLRDTVLSVTGKLSLQMGGPSYPLQKKGGGGSYIYATLDNDGPEVWRRAVYRFVVRGGERIMLDSFDCPDPSVATPQRAVSNTPVQALTLLNNDFLIRQAALLAQRLETEAPGSRAHQVRLAYSLLYGRQPRENELARDQRFLSNQTLQVYCRALLNSNEFLYVP
ncbi:MAG TPA: PSD1 and planctomycete cytochrome C domain-containing protein [Bryobacteraceae bacterium]|nr:PSD1 and planctomycete cytochrome C domain-containing protein [Bryobacteraceae bacterium]